MIDLNPIWLTLELAFATTFLLLCIGIPVSYWLYASQSKWKSLVEIAVSLPLILPPSVIGFYLLILLSPEHFFGSVLDQYLNIRLLFSFEGLLFCSLLYSMPFMINPLLSGFRSLNPSLQEASFTLGKSTFKTVIHVLLPNIKHAVLTGIVMAFAHTLGEFGVVLMVGGSIPNETRLVSIAIYDEIQNMNYDHANTYAFILLIISVSLLVLLQFLHKNNRKSLFL